MEVICWMYCTRFVVAAAVVGVVAAAAAHVVDDVDRLL